MPAVGPLLRRYVDDLIERLAAAGFRGRFLTMQSNGGVMTPEVLRDFAANTLLSGPASGPVAGLFFGRRHGLCRILTLDMGGTSLDVGLIRDGRPALSSATEVAEYALALPSLDINAIGAGGGSIAAVRDGILTVGPDSAGCGAGTGGLWPRRHSVRPSPTPISCSAGSIRRTSSAARSASMSTPPSARSGATSPIRSA